MNETESRKAMYYPKRNTARTAEVSTAVLGIAIVLLIVAVRVWR